MGQKSESKCKILHWYAVIHKQTHSIVHRFGTLKARDEFLIKQNEKNLDVETLEDSDDLIEIADFLAERRNLDWAGGIIVTRG